LRSINEILGSHNIEKQFSDSKGDIAYLMADISGVGEEEVKDIYAAIRDTRANILTRLLCGCLALCRLDSIYDGLTCPCASQIEDLLLPRIKSATMALP
jgi:hypothetical protein